MRRWVVAVVAVTAVVAGMLLVQGALPCDLLHVQPACYVALGPGPVEDTSGLIEVDGAPSFASSGELLLTTIAVDEELGFVEWLRASTSNTVDAVQREYLYPPGVDPSEVAEHNAALMADSQLTATIAALSQLGYELHGEGARVTAVADDAVTDELQPDDVIVAVDGRRIEDSAAVVDAVQGRTPGERISLEILRAGTHHVVAVDLGEAPDEPGRAYVGVLLTTEVELPVDVRIDAGVIGGPSAGLMFALGIVDLLDPTDLTGGAVVAGTGTVDRDGTVGAVGGVRQKLLGATAPRGDARSASVFLVPRGNLDEAGATPVSRDVLLVPVDSLEQALDALAALAAGRRPVDALALVASDGGTAG